MQFISIIAVFNNDDKILLCKRSKEPYKNLIDLVGGKAEQNEDGMTCAYRELFEETGITSDDIELHHLMDFTYCLSDVTVRVYFGRLKNDVNLVEEINPLFWSDTNVNFSDTTKYSGAGYLTPVLIEINLHRELISLTL